MYDIVNTPGVAADLSHIATPAKVEGYLPPDDGLKKTLTGADVVVIPAGVPRKPGVRLLFFPPKPPINFMRLCVDDKVRSRLYGVSMRLTACE